MFGLASRTHVYKSLLLLATVAFGIALTLSSGTRHALTMVSAGEASTGPAEIYAAHCAKCHGSDGRARTSRGKRAGATDFTGDWNRDEARGVRIITNGKSEMPAFKGKLSAKEIRAVFSYVLRFR